MKQSSPPRIARFLIRLFGGEHDTHHLISDFDEEFRDRVVRKNNSKAKLWYWIQAIKSIPRLIKKSIFWGAVMFKNYIKIAYRNFIRYKMYTSLNILGLAIGLSACILIYLWVKDELSYDTYLSNADRIFRTEQKYITENGSEQWPITSGAFGPTLMDEYPEIINYCRLWRRTYTFKDYRNALQQRDLVVTDNSVFDMFNVQLISGDKSTALKEPDAVVLTPEVAKIFFGTDDVVGKTLPLEWGDDFIDMKVTGVFKPVPHNSHAQFDMLMSTSSFNGQNVLDHFKWNFLYTYVQLEKGTSAKELEPKFSTFLYKHRFSEAELKSRGVTEANIENYLQLKLKPVTAIHLDPCSEWEIGPQGNWASVYMFSSIAVLILIIACINFINLSTARAKKRAKEVGMRKTMGAFSHQLWKQFLSESLIITIISLLISILVVVIVLPYFNELSGKAIDINSLISTSNLLMLFTITTVTGLLSGLYPAFYLTSFSPASVFRGSEFSGHRKSVFRNYLVVAQFVISIALIIGTITIQDQMQYIQNKSLGFDKENVIVIPARNRSVRRNVNAFRKELLLTSKVKSVAVSTNTPGDNLYSDTEFVLDQEDKGINLTYISVDYDFAETYGLNFIAGRNFAREFGSDTAGSTLILNETAVKQYGITPEEILTRKLSGSKVVGVIKDFNFKSLHKEVEPMALIFEPQRVGYISARLMPGDYQDILSSVKNVWNKVNPGQQLDFNFLDERLNMQYEAEIKTNNLFFIFSTLSIFVACLGLFGLAAFTTEERTKEIGIRKVLGASIPSIFTNLIKQLTKWVLVANIIAWPVAYYIMNSWLQDFAYRIDISIWTFAMAGLIALVIAVGTISYQSIKAAISNPSDILKYE